MAAETAGTASNSKATKDTSWLRKLAEFQSPWYMQVAALSLFMALFWVVFRSPTLAVALIVSMYFHEASHARVLIGNGIRTYIGLLFPLGAIAMPLNEEEEAKSNLLHWNTTAWLLQAGPISNVVLMFLGWIMQVSGFFPQFGKDLTYINGILAISNLLPVWKLDAGQLFHVIFSSLTEKWDKVLSWIASLISLVGVSWFLLNHLNFTVQDVLVRLVLTSPILVLFMIVVGGIWHAQSKDNPEHSKSVLCMSHKQVAVHLVVYFATLLTAIAFSGGF